MDGFNFQNNNQGNNGNPMPPNWNMPTGHMNLWATPNPSIPWQFQQPNPSVVPPWINNQSNNQPNNFNNNQNNQQNNNFERQTIPCGIVASEGEIKPGEVPMNGGFGMFIKNDASRIYVKKWGSDGNIHTKTFIEETVDENASEKETELSLNDLLNIINKRFAQIEELIATLSDIKTKEVFGQVPIKKQNNQKNNQRQEG